MSHFPNTFIIGAAKAGTTSLYDYLAIHPDVYMSPVKEPHFFSVETCGSERQHLAQVVNSKEKYISLFNQAKHEKVVGEASTSYLHHAQFTSQRISQAVPDAKIIIILRDPIERAFSHYLMDKRVGIEKRDFLSALQEDEKKLGSGRDAALFIEMGFYAQQLKFYLDCFDQKQILILFFEELVNSPLLVLNTLADFLQIDNQPFIDMQAKKSNGYVEPRNIIFKYLLYNKYLHSIKHSIPVQWKSFLTSFIYKKAPKPILDQQAIYWLQQIYTSDIQMLEKLLNKDVSILRKVWL